MIEVEVDERATAERILARVDIVDWIMKVKRHEHRLMKSDEALKNVVSTLVKFAVHDPLCERVAKGSRTRTPPPELCTCGLQKVYDRIDELIE